MGKPKYYKYCIVPRCTSTTTKSKDKIFFSVPRTAQPRKQWCNAMKRGEVKYVELSEKSPLYCCEDHFDLKEDTANYMEYRILREQGYPIKLRLKMGVIPHKFSCQEIYVPEIEGSLVAKKRKWELDSTSDFSMSGIKKNRTVQAQQYQQVATSDNTRVSTSASVETIILLFESNPAGLQQSSITEPQPEGEHSTGQEIRIKPEDIKCKMEIGESILYDENMRIKEELIEDVLENNTSDLKASFINEELNPVVVKQEYDPESNQEIDVHIKEEIIEVLQENTLDLQASSVKEESDPVYVGQDFYPYFGEEIKQECNESVIKQEYDNSIEDYKCGLVETRLFSNEEPKPIKEDNIQKIGEDHENNDF